jgi:hypothetical protein
MRFQIVYFHGTASQNKQVWGATDDYERATVSAKNLAATLDKSWTIEIEDHHNRIGREPNVPMAIFGMI